MKKNELNFKVAFLTEKRLDIILDELYIKGIRPSANPDRAKHEFLYCIDGEVWPGMLAANFVKQDLPEVTFQQAVDLIKQVEPENQKGGEFLEFKVDEQGFFSVDEHSVTLQWQSAWGVAAITEDEYTFAGWKWAQKDYPAFYSAELQGCNQENKLTSIADKWAKPAHPTHVRFWKKSS